MLLIQPLTFKVDHTQPLFTLFLLEVILILNIIIFFITYWCFCPKTKQNKIPNVPSQAHTSLMLRLPTTATMCFLSVGFHGSDKPILPGKLFSMVNTVSDGGWRRMRVSNFSSKLNILCAERNWGGWWFSLDLVQRVTLNNKCRNDLHTVVILYLTRIILVYIHTCMKKSSGTVGDVSSIPGCQFKNEMEGKQE